MGGSPLKFQQQLTRKALSAGVLLVLGLASTASTANDRETQLVYDGIRKVHPELSTYCALPTDAKRAIAVQVTMELASKRRLKDPMAAGPAAGIRLRQECGEDTGGIGVASVRWASTFPALTLDLSAKPYQPRESIKGLSNSLRVPDGSGPFPAVVLTHTIGGVSEHLGVVAERLVSVGYAVLVLDSMGPRDVQPGGRILPSEGVKDAYDALGALASQPHIDPSRIFQVGYSWGAFVAAMLTSPEGAQTYKATTRFRASVGHYGTCSLSSDARTATNASQIETVSADLDRPLLMLMAAGDIETPPESCFPALEQMKAQGKPVDWHIYPEATHGWDKRENNGYVYRNGQGQTMAYRYDQTVTEDSIRRTLDFLNAFR